MAVDSDTANFHPCIKDSVDKPMVVGTWSTRLCHVNLNADTLLPFFDSHVAIDDCYY